MSLYLNLLWKEWHEHKWKLLALTTIVLSVFLTLLSEDTGNMEFALTFTLFGYAIFAPVFVAMGVGTAEQSSRSINFVRAQPVSLKIVAAVRVLVGMCVLVIPLLCGFSCSCVVAQIWEQTGPQSAITNAATGFPNSWTTMQTMCALTGIGIGACINLYAWIVAGVVNQRNEFRAGLIGLVMMVGLIVVGMNGFWHWRDYDSILWLIASISTPTAYLDMVGFIHISRQQLIPVTIVWQAMLNGGLFFVMVRRYGHEDEWFTRWIDRLRRRDEAKHSVLGRAMKSPWRALFWLQMRQTIPVGLVGFTIVVFTPLFTRAVDMVGWHAFVGSMLALIIGVGSFVHELEPKLHTFWRSRPISPSAWFWLKFAAGFFVLIVLFDLPYVLLAWLRLQSFYAYIQLHPTVSAVYPPPIIVAFFPVLLHLLIYSLAVLSACAVRHSIYSMILALCAVLAILLPPIADWGRIPDWLSFVDLWSRSLYRHDLVALNFSIAATFVVAIALPVTLLAATLIKRDVALNA